MAAAAAAAAQCQRLKLLLDALKFAGVATPKNAVRFVGAGQYGTVYAIVQPSPTSSHARLHPGLASCERLLNWVRTLRTPAEGGGAIQASQIVQLPQRHMPRARELLAARFAIKMQSLCSHNMRESARREDLCQMQAHTRNAPVPAFMFGVTLHVNSYACRMTCMELLDGAHTLTELHRSENVHLAPRVFKSIRDAVYALWHAGVVHGDLHMDNILVKITHCSEDGKIIDVRIIDFGMSVIMKRGLAELLSAAVDSVDKETAFITHVMPRIRRIMQNRRVRDELINYDHRTLCQLRNCSWAKRRKRHASAGARSTCCFALSMMTKSDSTDSDDVARARGLTHAPPGACTLLCCVMRHACAGSARLSHSGGFHPPHPPSP